MSLHVTYENGLSEYLIFYQINTRSKFTIAKK